VRWKKEGGKKEEPTDGQWDEMAHHLGERMVSIQEKLLANKSLICSLLHLILINEYLLPFLLAV